LGGAWVWFVKKNSKGKTKHDCIKNGPFFKVVVCARWWPPLVAEEIEVHGHCYFYRTIEGAVASVAKRKRRHTIKQMQNGSVICNNT